MLPTVLGLSLSSLLLWSGPPSLPPDEATPAAPAESSAEPTTVPVQHADGAPDASEPGASVPEASPEPEPPPEPEPSHAPPTAEVAPVTAVPMPESELPELGDRVAPGFVVVRPPRWRGTGLFVGSAGLLASALIFQLTDGLSCGNCAIGVVERVFLAGSMGLAAGGGVVRAHADAYDDTAMRRERRNPRRALIAGATLTGAGAVLGLVNDGLWWRCIVGNAGPYTTEPVNEFDFSFNCRYGLTRGLLDVASISTATGLGLLSWSLAYRRDAKAYERARVIGFRPTVGRNRWMLGMEGRF